LIALKRIILLFLILKCALGAHLKKDLLLMGETFVKKLLLLVIICSWFIPGYIHGQDAARSPAAGYNPDHAKTKLHTLGILSQLAKEGRAQAPVPSGTTTTAASQPAPRPPMPGFGGSSGGMPKPPRPDMAALFAKRLQIPSEGDATAAQGGAKGGFRLAKPATKEGAPATEPAWKKARRELEEAEAREKAAAAAAHLLLPTIEEIELIHTGAPETLTSLLAECTELPEIFKHRDLLTTQPPTFLTYPRLLKLVQMATQFYTNYYNRPSTWKAAAGSTYTETVGTMCAVQPSGFLQNNLQPMAFFEKIEIPATSKIINIGDLHGSLHALLRILVMLYARNLIDNSLCMQADSILIFNGDLTDRGTYSAEVCYLAFLLKVRNPRNVFIVAGNHEDFDQNNKDGFSKEFEAKFPGKTTHGKPNLIQQLYRFLPLAIYTGVVNEKTSTTIWQQSSHGGFSTNFKSKKDFFDSPECIFYMPGGDQSIYNWGDYRRSEDGVYGCFHRSDTHIHKDPNNCADVRSFFEDKEIGIALHNRGHQDTIFSTCIPPKRLQYEAATPKDTMPPTAKTLYENYIQMLASFREVHSAKDSAVTNFIAAKTSDCSRYLEDKTVKFGQFYWQDATESPDARSFQIRDMEWPVITCSAATSTQYVLNTACLLTQTTADEIGSWHFEPLIIDHIPALTTCYKALATDGRTMEDPSILYHQLTINADNSVSVRYAPEAFTTAFIDERGMEEKEGRSASALSAEAEE
jgi:hypothetical protein